MKFEQAHQRRGLFRCEWQHPTPDHLKSANSK